MAKLNFNAADKEPMQERTLVPVGKYAFQIVKSEIVPNSKKTAYRLNMQAKLFGNKDFKGCIVFIGLNWDHPNPEAQAISDREFKSICDAVGMGNEEITDTESLHGKPFYGTIRHTPPSGDYIENGETKYKYGPKAEFEKYEAYTGEDSAPTETVSPETTSVPPWDK